METIKQDRGGSILHLLETGNKIIILYKDKMINLQVLSKTNAQLKTQFINCTVINNKVEEFGDWLDFDKLNDGAIYKILKNPTSNINFVLFCYKNDKVIDRQYISKALLKSYERKYLK